MKKFIITMAVVVAFIAPMFAQAPQGFNYQAVVRNTAGQLMSNRTISVRISILRGSETGTVVYHQQNTLGTNANGLFTLIVGEDSETFASIDWSNGPYFILSEIDPQGGSNYTLSTVQKLLSVPYAHYADVARRIDGSFVYDEQDPRFSEWGYAYDSLKGAPTRLSDFINDLEFPFDTLQPHISGDTLFFGFNDTYVILPNLGGGAMEIRGDTLFMGDEFVVLPSVTPSLSDILESGNDANYNYIHNLATPKTEYDAANKLYVDSMIALTNSRIDSLLAAMGSRVDSLVAALNSRIDSMGSAYRNITDSMSRHIYNLEHPIVKGALPGIFSVSATTRVNFSQGNLQYRPRIKTWRFAEHQYDVAGSDNNNVYMQGYCSSWIDLFGYGTSSWDGGAGRFMPYETTTNDSEYTEAVDGNDLTGFYANADWGYYNPIINGGNQMAIWRTLTYSEWSYLLTQRPNAAQLRGLATVVGTPGYIILPDDFRLPEGQTFVNTNSDYTTNVYNSTDWSLLEAAGAVFLPAAGMRSGSSTTDIGNIGNYWSATHVNGTTGYAFHIGINVSGMLNTMANSTGCSVRVVHEY